MKRPMGAPPKYTAEEIAVIRQDLEAYIAQEDDPTIVGFTAYYTKYPVNKDYIHDRSEFSELSKRAIEKQEAFLQAGATQNRLNSTFSIFRLKQPQHGWRDQPKEDEETDRPHITFINMVPPQKDS